MVDSNADHHHYGSRQFVADLTADERSALVGMISVDMVAYGTTFTVRTMKRGPQQLADRLLDYSSAHGFGATFLKDTRHLRLERPRALRAGRVPGGLGGVARGPQLPHRPADSYDHVKSKSALVERTGEMLLGFLLGLTAADLDRWPPRARSSGWPPADKAEPVIDSSIGKSGITAEQGRRLMFCTSCGKEVESGKGLLHRLRQRPCSRSVTSRQRKRRPS